MAFLFQPQDLSDRLQSKKPRTGRGPGEDFGSQNVVYHLVLELYQITAEQILREVSRISQ